MSKVIVDVAKVQAISEIVSRFGVPQEAESGTHGFAWPHSVSELANAYLAIVAICHQTSPIGERQLQGRINDVNKGGWDYLKEKFLTAASAEPSLLRPDTWAAMTPTRLSELYLDEVAGVTLNRVNERAYLLNDLGRWMVTTGVASIDHEFERRGRRFLGAEGLLAALASAAAYSDPVQKKSLFFASLAVMETKWEAVDFNSLRSPVDYHELRGHLRIGTVKIADRDLAAKVSGALPVTSDEDADIRAAVQRANDEIAERSSQSSSRIHYLMWNVFRQCCPRPSTKTHCERCSPDCGLPPQYKAMPGYSGRCVFATQCESAGLPNKVSEPPYIGHCY